VHPVKLAVPPSSTSQLVSLKSEALLIIHRGRGVIFFEAVCREFPVLLPHTALKNYPSALQLFISCAQRQRHIGSCAGSLGKEQAGYIPRGAKWKMFCFILHWGL